MAIILNEDTAEASPLDGALIAFVEAAMASEVDYTPEALREMVDEQIEIMSEAGGLVSWIKAHYTGVDNGAAKAFERTLEVGIKSKSHRNKLLATITAMIEKAERAETGSTAMDFGKGALTVGLPAFIFSSVTSGASLAGMAASGAARAVMTAKNRESGAIERYIKVLKELREKIKNAPLSD